MRNFVAGIVAAVTWGMGASLPGNALVIDDFEDGPFSIGLSTTSTTITISGLPAEHVAGGERRVTLSGRAARASLSLSEGDDRATASSPDSYDNPRLGGFSIEFAYANLGGVDLTSGGSESTLVVAGSGAISVTIDGQTLSTSSGRIPLSSFHEIDPTQVDEISVRLVAIRGGIRSLSDVRTVGPAEILSQCRADLAASNLALYDAELALGQCSAAPPFADADGDGEVDATDACPATPAGLPIDGAGCARSQFCAARRATCTTNDWMNDEPTRKKPGDCLPNKRARTCN